MPLCAPVAAGNGLFWRTFDNYTDQNFCIQQYSGPVWWSDNYRIIITVNSTQVASAKLLDDIKRDWEFIQSRIQEEVTKSGLRVFSEKFLITFCKHLFKDADENAIEVPLDQSKEKEAFINNFFAKLRNGEGVGDITWLVPYSMEWFLWEDSNGMTPLHIAVDLKMPDLVKTCIAKGADVNHKDVQGWAPLHFAAYRGDLEICELLIQTGNAAVMSISKDGTLPLHYLVRYSPTDAERRKYLSVLELLIKKGAPINAQTKHGETPLHQACLKGAADAAEFLLNQGADCNIKNNNGETALCFAVISAQKLIVTMLVERGADCTIGGPNGSALELAKRLDHKELYYFLSGFAKIKNTPAPISLMNSGLSNSAPSTPTGSHHNPLSPPPLPHHSSSLSSLTHSNSAGNLASESVIKSKKQVTGEIYPHSFQLTHFSSLTWCAYCGYFVWGIRRQGYVCMDCQYTVHPKCKKLAVLSETCKIAQEKAQTLSSTSLNSFSSLSSLSAIPIPNGNRPGSALSSSPSSPASSSPASSTPTSSITCINNNTPPNNEALTETNTHTHDNNNTNNYTDTVTEDLSESEDLTDGQVPEELDAFKHNFTPEFMDLLYTQFNVLDRVQRGYLQRDEFGSTLGTVINDCGLLDALFAAFDQNKDGKIDIREYFVGMSVLMNGDLDSQIKFAFAMMDRDGDGYLTRQELRSLTESMHRSLGNVQLVIDRDPDYFTDHIFPKSLHAISLPLYKEHVVKHIHFVQSLGLLDDAGKDNSPNETTEQNNANNYNDNNGTSSMIQSKKKRAKGRTITLGNESWHMVQHLMLGIRQAVGEATYSLEKEELKSKDFEEQVDFKLVNSAGECYWIFKDFAPMVFKKIREIWHIDPKSYMFSLGPEKILGNLLLGNLSALCEVVSTGRSGSLFFKTNDGKYLLKTVPAQEELLARQILPAYHSHVSKFPNMLMTKFLGLHTMARGPSGRQQDLRFVVMTNVFDTPLKIHEQYDLKGSTVGRHVDVTEKEDEDDEERDAEIALKDLDFKRRIYLGPENKAILLEQLEQDCKFMEQHNICDYSFLVGVHRIDERSPLYNSANLPVPPSPKPFSQCRGQPSLFQSYYGGILSYDKKEVYFLGIIDTLTTWDLRKKSEKTFKSIFHDSSQISAIAPIPYRSRFQRYISSIVD